MTNIFKPVLLMVSMMVAAQGAAAGGDAAAGEGKVAVCAACHGADGNSAAPNFPKLAGLGEKYLTKQLQDIKNGDIEKGGRPILEMTGLLDGMSDQDLMDIAAFYASKPMQLSGSKEEMEVLLNSGVTVNALKVGESVYRAGNASVGVPACTGCHSPAGLGNAPAGYPRLGGQHADYIEKQLKDFRAGKRVNDGDTMIMRGVAKNLSDSEIKALANYIAGLN